ncbi:MAG: HAMP domain-containing histidine kinase [Clostridiales bacterium]|jgi:signal transduction histidine kinase|nr:HAMP domain-containing histidine kinase [Clostridiales bacterium]
MSIRAKLFAYLLLFCSFLLAALWLFQVVLLDAIYKRIKIAEVNSAMTTLVANFGSENFGNIADGLYESRGVNAAVLSPEGAVAYANGEFLRQRDAYREFSRLYALTRENGGEYFEYPLAGGAADARGGAPRDTGRAFGAPRGLRDIYHCKLTEDSLIVLSAMISPVDATVDTLKLELYAITVIMLLFSVGLAVIIARRIAKPIVALNQSAKRLARGEYNTVFDTKGYREITELAGTLNVAARELSAVEEMRRELMANVSHDLRTPLTLIEGYAEAMRDLPGENTPENAQIIVDEAKRLNRLVSEVLDLSKLQSGAMEPRLAEYNLTRSVSGIVERLAEFTKANGYRVIWETSGDAVITADENAVSQAVYNLLTNAIAFTGEDKTVTVRQLAGPASVTLEIEDSGKGVGPEELPYIWDRYYRTGKKHKRAVVGSGIGLSIVKSVMDLHGGEYGVKPADGGGSVFWIRFNR